MKADRELLVSQNVEGASQGQVAKKVVELGKKIRALSTELEAEKTKSRNAEKKVRILTNQNDQLKAKLKQSNQEEKIQNLIIKFSFYFNAVEIQNF